MVNNEKLKKLIVDVFLLEEDEFSFGLTKREIGTWDSLGTVSLAVGVQETFGYHFKPEEALAINSVKDVITILESHGIAFDR